MTNLPPRIVLIDDDYDFLDVQKYILEAQGYNVVSFCHPDQAFEYILKHIPDLVITDLMMNTLDAGFSLARRIKEHPDLAEVPVIILTAISHRRGYDMRPQTKEQQKAMNVDGYLEKPVAPDVLLVRVEELLKSARPKRS